MTHSSTPTEPFLSEDDVKLMLKGWLESQGWTSQVAWGHSPGADIIATRGRDRWVIEVKGAGSRPQMRVNYFLAILGEILQRMESSTTRHSIALPDIRQYRGLWQRLPDLAKERLSLSLLLVAEDGSITHLNSQ